MLFSFSSNCEMIISFPSSSQCWRQWCL